MPTHPCSDVCIDGLSARQASLDRALVQYVFVLDVLLLLLALAGQSILDVEFSQALPQAPEERLAENMCNSLAHSLQGSNDRTLEPSGF